MALLIPNIILDSVVCDTCYKYLSALPVKVFPNRKIICGRCTISSKEEGGTISLYNEIAKRSIFKCINRFDGCEVLLTTAEVLQHEETCKSKNYLCPICLEEISSYLMIKHFKNNHNNVLLSTPHFIIKKIDSTYRYFLYNFENYLVFIKFLSVPLSYQNFINASINCMLLGNYGTEKSLKLNITITYGELIIEKQINCRTFFSDAEDGLKIKLKLNNCLLNVMFSLEMTQSVLAIPSLQPSTELVESNLFIKKILLNFYFKERDTYLPSDKIFSCFFCYTLTWTSRYMDRGVSYIDFVNVSGKYYIICHFCALEKNWKRSKKIIYPVNLENVSVFCRWMCGKYVTIDNLSVHEKKCKDQITQPCPVKLCKYSCKLYEIEQHFKNKHNNNNDPVLVFSFSGDEMRYSRKEMLSLKPNYNTRMVLVQSHIYITVDFVWEQEQTVWFVYLNCEIPNAEPTMIILDENRKFIACIKIFGAIHHLNKFYYKCYLSHPERQHWSNT